MRLRALGSLGRDGWLLYRVTRWAVPFYRLAWLASASSGGVLDELARGPAPLSRLARALGIPHGGEPALEAWLRVGVRLRVLRVGAEGYSLRGALARSLARPERDALAAILEEAAGLHHALILRTPERLRSSRPWTLSDQDGRLIARSSRILEPIVCGAVDALLPRSGRHRLLEVGAGAAVYIRHAAARNPELTALGVELQAEVAELAAANLAGWGLEGRARIETGDIRHRQPDASFDTVTLHNNIYYFPVDERVGLLRHLRGFLKPGGHLLLTTGCQGGSAAMEVLNLWSTATQGCGPLPTPAQMCEQLRAAGLHAVRAERLLPGESYYAFVGTEPD